MLNHLVLRDYLISLEQISSKNSKNKMSRINKIRDKKENK
nr:MAG TPA: hypothetical protein [Caudoviricetes sp.]